jgi:haloalkane dehalogenase
MEPNSPADRTDATIPSEHSYREHLVPHGRHRLYTREYPGLEPVVVLLHGFPDDLHLYDWLFSTPLVRSVARPISRLFGDLVFGRMYRWQVGRFFRDRQVREQFLPLLYRQFTTGPSAHEAFFGLNRDLRHALTSGTANIPRLRRFGRPVRIVFGAADPYLNRRVARRFHQLFPTSELVLVPGARHYVQMDAPGEVARQILTIPDG